VYLIQGKVDDAEVYFQRALEARRQLGEKKGTAISLNYLGNIERLRGRLDKAMARYLEVLKISKEIGWRSGEAETRGYMATVMAHQGRYRAALESQDEALGIFEELGDKNGIAWSLVARSKLECSLGECGAAADTVARALEMAGEIGNEELIADALLARGTMGNLSGSGSVVADLELARTHAEASGARITLLQVASELGRALRRDGKLEGALSVLDDVAREARSLGLESVRAVVEFYRAQTLLESGDRVAAKEAASTACEMAGSMGERELLLRCRSLLAKITRGDSDSVKNAICCLDEAARLVRELGESGPSFLSRPDVAHDISDSVEILNEAGRSEDLSRFPWLELGEAGGRSGGEEESA
jgi:tetratricopeptide (TPR) repeat protein